MIEGIRYTLPLAKQFALRPLRMVLNLTREQLSVELGVSFTTIVRWERGESSVNTNARRHLERLLRARGITSAKFIVDSPPLEKSPRQQCLM